MNLNPKVSLWGDCWQIGGRDHRFEPQEYCWEDIIGKLKGWSRPR